MTEDRAAFTGTLQQWLDRMAAADPDDRRMIAIEGGDAGLNHRKVHCGRCEIDLNWLSAYRHLERTEQSHAFHHRHAAPLHQAGDLRPAWRTSRCTICNRVVIWATTLAGNAMPIDPDPVGTGHVQLTARTDSDDDRPLALILRTEYEQRGAVGPRYQVHANTCGRRRRPRTST